MATRMADQQQSQVVLPSYSAWFSIDAIHEIERRSLPEFFDEPPQDGSAISTTASSPYKTAAVYKEYRDFMIHTYRLNPSEYLSLTTCRRHLVGDAGSILRVHSFLDQWGLINYQVANEAAKMPPTLAHKPKVAYECPRGMVTFAKSTADIAISNISQPLQATTSATGYLFPDNSDLIARQAVAGAREGTASTSSLTIATAKPLYCFTCGVLLKTGDGKGRYHCLKDTSVNLCKGCFLEGRFPINLYSGDFVRLGAESSDDGAFSNEKWTDEEVLLLLEGVEMFQEDWNKVAEHVGTRSTVQCIAQFLQLPIYEAIATSPMGPAEPLGAGALGDNPVISTVTFLASLVHPKVAAAAASAAVAEAKGMASSSMQVDYAPESKELSSMQGENEADALKATIPVEQLESIAATALGIGAVKAKEIADVEHKNIQQLLYSLVELVLKKIDLKIGQFDELEKQLLDERREIDNQRNSVLLERLKLRKTAAMLQQQQQQQHTGPQQTTPAGSEQPTPSISRPSSPEPEPATETEETPKVIPVENPIYTAL